MPRLKYAVKLNPSKHELPLLSVDMNVSFIPMDAVSERGEIRPEARKLDSVNEGFTYFRNGDVVMAKITPCFENGKGAVIHDLVNNIGFGTTEFLVLRPGRLDSKYLYYLISSHRFRKYGEMEMRGSAGQKRVPEAYVANYVVDELDIDEQKKRANFLDKKTVLIDRAIEQKRKLIRLLKEKRTALINRAVTRGLDEDVELVDSGEEWIGMVPKGWSVERLKSIANINRDVLSEDTPSDYVIRYLDIGDVGSDGALPIPTEYQFENAPSRARRLVRDGTVILATVRTYLKAISYIDKPANNLIVSTGFATLDATKKVLPKYLYYMASSELIIQNVVRHSTGVSYPAIAPTVLGGLPVIYPSLEIQKQIVTSLDKRLALIDSGVEKIQTSIKLLSEYRTSLISHAVTGKVEI